MQRAGLHDGDQQWGRILHLYAGYDHRVDPDPLMRAATLCQDYTVTAYDIAPALDRIATTQSPELAAILTDASQPDPAERIGLRALAERLHNYRIAKRPPIAPVAVFAGDRAADHPPVPAGIA